MMRRGFLALALLLLRLAGCTAESGLSSSAASNAPARRAQADREEEGTAAREVDLLAHLLVKVDSDFPLRHSDGDIETLFAGGQAASGLGCHAEVELAVDPEEVDSRKLHLSQKGDDQGLLASFWRTSSGSGDPTTLSVSVTDASVSVVPGPNANTLSVALEEPLPNGTELVVPTDSEGSVDLTVQYDCVNSGDVGVRLRFAVLTGFGSAAHRKYVCMSWQKQCARSDVWKHLTITEEEDTVFEDGSVEETWQTRADQGVLASVTKFEVKSDGLMRLRMPKVSAPDKFLQVSLRGPFMMDAQGQHVVDVGTEPVAFSVLYICDADGLAQVHMDFEKAVLSPEHQPERLRLQWKKRCGVALYEHLSVTMKGEGSGKAVEAVTNGVVAEGFGPPCSLVGDVGGGSSQKDGGNCWAGETSLQVPVKETRTGLDFVVSTEGLLHPPAFQPMPDLSYDKRILSVHITQKLRSPAHAKHRSKNGQPMSQYMGLKYTCFRDGMSVIMLTVHVLAHKPIEIAWTKHCKEPKAHVGSALTAQQALLGFIFLCIIFFALLALLHYCCNSNDQEYEEEETELSSLKARRKKYHHQEVIGRELDKLEEAVDEGVTYH